MARSTKSRWAWGIALLSGLACAVPSPAQDDPLEAQTLTAETAAADVAFDADAVSWHRAYGWGGHGGAGYAVGAAYGGPYHYYGYHPGWAGYGYAPFSRAHVYRPYYFGSIYGSYYRPGHFGFAWYRPSYEGAWYGYAPGAYSPYGYGFYGGYGYHAYGPGCGAYGYGGW